MKIFRYFSIISIILIALIASCGFVNSETQTSISDELRFAILGDGMDGPNGSLYEVSPEGFIFLRQYKIKTSGGFDRIPARLTLPTRYIVPIGRMSTCYKCHRLNYAVPTVNTQLRTALVLPAIQVSDSGLKKLTQVTKDPLSSLV